ncbi:MAG: adenylyl-sulfate kinase [Candidatus Palauibacterales bacterium]|nr:adenylyl-sulfate kinase [Candidatus Palauibacterales bacterium]MDP2584614.1 adenylyl-sulfate kinase [Candidatus Palauibacterales bacterium]
MSPKSKNIFWQQTRISREDRETRRGHRGAVLWFTGLSGSGKSTLASRLEERLYREGYSTYILDGDNVRHGLNRDLGFSPEDRTENIRRVGEVAKLFADAGVLVATAFISPYREDRGQVRAILERDMDFVEIFVSCPLEVCEARDPKGLYKKARAGEIKGFTGIDAPYQEPEEAELVVETDRMDPDESVDVILGWLEARGYIRLHEKTE